MKCVENLYQGIRKVVLSFVKNLQLVHFRPSHIFCKTRQKQKPAVCLNIIHKKPKHFFGIPFTTGIKIAGSPNIFQKEVKEAILSMENKNDVFPMIHSLAQIATSKGYRLYLFLDKEYPEIDLSTFVLEDNIYYTL